MILPVVKFNLSSFNSDLQDRIERSNRVSVEIVNQTALDVALKSFAACPLGASAKSVGKIRAQKIRQVTFRTGRTVSFRSSIFRDVNVGTYYKHNGNLKGFNFDALNGAEGSRTEGRSKSGRWFLKSRFVKAADAMGRAMGRQPRTGEASKGLNDAFGYGTPAKANFFGKMQAVLFASFQYKTDKGATIKTITNSGQYKMNRASTAGMLAVQNGWRAYANKKLQAALNKTN